MNARRIGTIDFDPGRLWPEIDALVASDLYSCAESVGSWKLGRNLWSGDGLLGDRNADGVYRTLPYIHQHVQETFKTELITLARIFAATRGGYVLPHRDWHGSEPRFTRLHIALKTDDRCLNSEDDAVYHMAVGDIWYLDGGRPHSGGCFSETVRLHLVLDFTPGVALPDLFRARARYEPSGSGTLIERPPFTRNHLAAILELAEIASETNLPTSSLCWERSTSRNR